MDSWLGVGRKAMRSHTHTLHLGPAQLWVCHLVMIKGAPGADAAPRDQKSFPQDAYQNDEEIKVDNEV